MRYLLDSGLMMIFNLQNSVSVQPLLNVFGALESNPAEASRCIRSLRRSSLHEQVQAMDAVAQAMGIALCPTTPTPFSNEVVAIWNRLENIIPRSLCEVCNFAL
ncbi:unnamed protein product [Gongylonema pulchrum]|uniref:Uncharacterized protein n=1 Tax=Gongylonema pulchrum TaxID=637853 RepID=A0A183DL73_9BILA|nr:unnamed protein product [Gongylonema pulchrum]